MAVMTIRNLDDEVLLGLCEAAGPDFTDVLPRREPYQPRVTFE